MSKSRPPCLNRGRNRSYSSKNGINGSFVEVYQGETDHEPSNAEIVSHLGFQGKSNVVS